MKNFVKKAVLTVASLSCALTLGFGVAEINAGAVDASSADLFTGAFVTLSDDITAKFNYTVPAGYTSATATFTYKGEQEEPLTLTVAEGENTLAFDGVQPAMIGEKIDVELVLTGDGKDALVDVETFTIADYIENLLTADPAAFVTIKSQEQYVAMRTLAANLVGVSAKTQVYQGREDTSSALLKTSTVRNFVSSSVPAGTDLDVGELADDAEYGYIGAKLILGSKVDVAFYFAAKDTSDLVAQIKLGEATTSVSAADFEEATDISVKDGFKAYRAIYKGLSVTDFDKVMTAKLLKENVEVGNTVTYSVKSYVYAMQSSNNANMKALATALYNYGLAAQTYVDAMSKTYEVELPTHTEHYAFNDVANVSDGEVYARLQGGWIKPAGKAFSASLTSDGEYLYGLAYKASLGAVDGKYTNSFNFVKFDINGNQIGYSKAFDGVTKANVDGTQYQYGGLEYYTPLWIKDGYAYSYNGAGKTIRVATSALTENSVDYEEVEDVRFGTFAPETVNSVVYNSTLKKFVVVAAGKCAIYADDDLTNAVVTGTESFNRRLTADENYIYVTISGNETYQPTIYVKDWNLVDKTNFVIHNDADVMKFSVTKNTKTQGIAICNGQFYYQLIEWSNSKTALLEANKTNIVADYSVDSVVIDYNFNMSATKVTGWNANTASLVLNAVQKNGWVYSIRNIYGSTGGYLVRYNYVTDKQVAVSAKVDNFRLGSEDAALFTYAEKVYLYDVGNSRWLSLPLLFNSGDEWAVETSLPVSLGDYANNFENIYVFEDTDTVVVYKGSTIVVLKDGVVQKTFNVSTSKKNRMGGGKNGYVYYTANAEDTLNPVVTVINVYTGKSKVLTLPSSLSSAEKTSITSVFELNGGICYSMFTWNGSTSSYAQIVNFDGVVNGEKPYKEFGEAIELTETDEVLTLMPETTLLPSISGTVKGVVTDGTYYYMANYAGKDESNAHCTQIIKTNKAGNVLGKSGKFKNGGKESYNDTTYLLYKDGYVYAFSGQFTPVYRVKTDDITSDNTPSVEETTDLTFAGISKISAMAYDAVNDRYAVRNGSTLYLVDGATKTVYKTISGAVDGTQVGVTVDENYVYCLKETTGGIAFFVYNWQGNQITQFIQAGLIKENTSAANIPSMIIDSGKLYIFAKPWQGSYNGNVIIYTVDINSLAAVKKSA